MKTFTDAMEYAHQGMIGTYKTAVDPTYRPTKDMTPARLGDDNTLYYPSERERWQAVVAYSQIMCMRENLIEEIEEATKQLNNYTITILKGN